MTPLSPRTPGQGTASDSERTWLTIAAALLALGLLAIARPGVPDGPASPAPAPDLIVDPNTAPPGVLGALPRVGPVLLRRLVEAREQRPFDSLEDIDRRVRGVGPATLATLRPHLRIGPPSDVGGDRPHDHGGHP